MLQNVEKFREWDKFFKVRCYFFTQAVFGKVSPKMDKAGIMLLQAAVLSNPRQSGGVQM